MKDFIETSDIKNGILRFLPMENKKQYPVIKVPANGKPDWYLGARTMCFVYSKYKGNFILEGYRGEVEEYLKKNYTHYFYYESMWHEGEARGHWKFWKENVIIFEPERKLKRWKYEVRYSGDQQKELQLFFKRLPKRWIPEFDKF